MYAFPSHLLFLRLFHKSCTVVKLCGSWWPSSLLFLLYSSSSEDWYRSSFWNNFCSENQTVNKFWKLQTPVVLYLLQISLESVCTVCLRFEVFTVVAKMMSWVLVPCGPTSPHSTRMQIIIIIVQSMVAGFTYFVEWLILQFLYHLWVWLVNC